MFYLGLPMYRFLISILLLLVPAHYLAEQNTAHQVCYSSIYGENKKLDIAYSLCSKAAKTGNTNSLVLLAETLYMGYGVEQDYLKAGEIYLKAAEAGHVHAQLMLFFVHAVRAPEESTDSQIQLALEYLKKSAATGYPKAQELLKKYNELKNKS
jgi:TPR repeat protein